MFVIVCACECVRVCVRVKVCWYASVFVLNKLIQSRYSCHLSGLLLRLFLPMLLIKLTPGPNPMNGLQAGIYKLVNTSAFSSP